MDFSSPSLLDKNTFSDPFAKPDFFTDSPPLSIDDGLTSLAKDYLDDYFQLAFSKPENNSNSTDEFVTFEGEIALSDGKDDIIIGPGRGNPTGPLVRVIDPVTGADRFKPFFAFEPSFQGGVQVYGADVTGDGEPDIITASGPGRMGEVRVWELIDDRAVENIAYNFFPFGRGYTGGVEISVGSITAPGKIEIAAAQGLGGLVSIFGVSSTAADPNWQGSAFSGDSDWQLNLVRPRPIRQLRPFGSSYLGGVRIETADVGTLRGGNVSSVNPDGIMGSFWEAASAFRLKSGDTTARQLDRRSSIHSMRFVLDIAGAYQSHACHRAQPMQRIAFLCQVVSMETRWLKFIMEENPHVIIVSLRTLIAEQRCLAPRLMTIQSSTYRVCSGNKVVYRMHSYHLVNRNSHSLALWHSH